MRLACPPPAELVLFLLCSPTLPLPQERMALLERLECFEEACESVCMRQISRYSLRVTETY